MLMTTEDRPTGYPDDEPMPDHLSRLSSLEQPASSPGVYLRSAGRDHRRHHELDELWTGTRALFKEDRTPLWGFLLGLIVGGSVATGVCLVWLKPGMFPTLPTVSIGVNNPFTSPADRAGEATEGTPASSKAAVGGRVYEVSPGDTLGSIAIKFYGSSDPRWVDKIQRANHMDNPNQLSLGQRLVIPPKAY